MLRKITEWLSKMPTIFNLLRRIIEFNFITIKRIIKNEFSLDRENNPASSKDYNCKRILDVGCGTGEFCRLFDTAGYVGIDISQKYIDYAKKTYQRTFYCRDARKNGFPDSYFDNVMITGLLHHLDDASMLAVLKETIRVLKKNATVLLIEDAPISSRWNFIGRLLQRYDVGNNIRFSGEYQKILDKYFIISKYYPIRSGLWDYSVFVLLPK